MPTCPQCHHKWQVAKRGAKAPKAGIGRDPGPAQWIGCQGEVHEGDWCDKVRSACAADASIGKHPSGCPCTWCESRRAFGWTRNAVPDGDAHEACSQDHYAIGWDYPGMNQRQQFCPVTDWKAFRAARAVYTDLPHFTDTRDTWDRYYHAQTPEGKAGVPYVAPEEGA